MEMALDQGSAMVGERASGKARKAKPGHRTAVLVRPRGGSAGRGRWLRLGMSRPDSRSDPNGGSEPSSGRETIYWDSLPAL